MKGPTTPPKTERNREIARLRQAGLSYKAIAERFGISATRVQQIEFAQYMAAKRKETET